ncbi:hypothetical protein CFP56_017069 [Quercus suber]|uniref:Uncharacterized protein n=1 Tax=Quercus suber TaxID=58331 RepID=A0AAW0M1W0_QUESU
MKYQKAQEILSKRIQHRTTEQRFGKRLISCQKCHRPDPVLSAPAPALRPGGTYVPLLAPVAVVAASDEAGLSMNPSGGAARSLSPRALEEDFLGGDHGEPSSDVLVNCVAELRPRSALDGALAKPRISELTSASGGCDLNLIAIVVELVLNHLLDPVLVGTDHLPWRQQKVQVLSVVLIQLSPS